MQALADRISAVFVPAVLVVAVVALAAWLVFGIPSLGFDRALGCGISAFVGGWLLRVPARLALRRRRRSSSASLSPVFAGAAMAFSSVAVVSN